MSNAEDVLEKRYGFYEHPDLKECEILEYVNIDLVMQVFEKEDENNWKKFIKIVEILKIDDYDKETNTFNCSYRLLGEEVPAENEEENRSKNNGPINTRIDPFGFAVESQTSLKRFIPFSLHYKILEREMKLERAKREYVSNPTIKLTEFPTDTRPIYCCIKFNSGGWGYFKPVKVEVAKKHGEIWKIIMQDNHKIPIILDVKEDDEDYPLMYGKIEVGRFKLINYGK